jgi:hypothetical protein
MKRNVFTLLAVIVLLLCSTTLVFAGSTLKLIFNGQEVKLDVAPKN